LQGQFFITKWWLDTTTGVVKISTTTKVPVRDLLMPPLLASA
jgi:hypothetical protein